MSTRSPTLSVCMITAYPPERIAAILEPLTGYVDEVVIAVDARVDEAAIPRYRAIADQVHRIEYVLVDRHLGWLHAQCRGDWILKLDGDEVPSSAFVRKLPELLATRQVMQYWVPNWWLYPDRTRVLDELPWSPDFNNRLVRNVGTLWFEGMEHSHAVPSFPSRYVEEPVYHLELLEEDETARRAKVVRYEVTRPHLVAHGGGRLNEAYYLPELRSELRTRKLAPEDQATLERVIHSPVAPPSPSRAQEPSSTRASQPSDVPVTPLAELDRYWVGRSFAPSTYAARLELFSPIERLVPERAGPVYVRVVNLGTDRFPGLPQHDPPIRLAYRWLRPDGTVYIADGVRTFLPCPLEPGEAAVVPVTVAAPAPGAYVLELDLVHEDVRWFDCALRVDVEVGDPLGLPAVGPRLTVTRRGRRQRLARRRIPRILHRLWLGAADMPEDLGAGWRGYAARGRSGGGRMPTFRVWVLSRPASSRRWEAPPSCRTSCALRCCAGTAGCAPTPVLSPGVRSTPCCEDCRPSPCWSAPAALGPRCSAACRTTPRSSAPREKHRARSAAPMSTARTFSVSSSSRNGT